MTLFKKFLLGALMGFVLFCAFMGGAAFGMKLVRQDAVDHGCAMWEANQKTGNVSFKWKETNESLSN